MDKTTLATNGPGAWAPFIAAALAEEFDFSTCATRRLGQLQAEDIAAALSYYGGNRARAAGALGVPRSSLASAIRADAALTALEIAIRDSLIDDAESVIRRAVEAGDLSAARLVVTTLGKERGYTTRDELGHTVTGTLADAIAAASAQPHALPSDRTALED